MLLGSFFRSFDIHRPACYNPGQRAFPAASILRRRDTYNHHDD
jgi:hypothetical protein